MSEPLRMESGTELVMCAECGKVGTAFRLSNETDCGVGELYPSYVHRVVAVTAEPTDREVAALGWLSAYLASKAGAWDGDAPPWFPEPPEWLDLWKAALTATGEGEAS